MKYLYFAAVTILSICFLEYASGILIQREMKNELPIFEGILIDNKNILTIKPNFQYRWADNILVQTNQDGYRENFNFQDKDIHVAFMGDSFCFGHGVNVGERYSNRTADALAKRQLYSRTSMASFCYNNGFEPEHYEYFLQLHPDLKPQHLFINLYLGNDLEGDVRETVITKSQEGDITSMKLPWRYTYGDLFRNASDRYAWITWLKERSNIARVVLYRINKSSFREMTQDRNIPFPNGANSLETEMGKLQDLELRPFVSLSRIQKMMSARSQTQLHILVIPQNFMVGSDKNPHLSKQTLSYMSQIREARGLITSVMNQCQARQLECHDLSLVLHADDYLAYDGHWSIKGNQTVADYIVNNIMHVAP